MSPHHPLSVNFKKLLFDLRHFNNRLGAMSQREGTLQDWLTKTISGNIKFFKWDKNKLAIIRYA